MIRHFIALLLCFACEFPASSADYYPPPDAQGGWRSLTTREQIRRLAGLDSAKLDEVFRYIQRSTKNGGLLVARRGYLVYERYFGMGHREATPNSGSVGKSFTSIATGILVDDWPDMFPDGLDQRVFTRKYFPPETFPLSDPAKADIRLGQLLAMTAGIRGNNPGIIYGREVTLDPEGPDGWQAMVDEIAVGHSAGTRNAVTLWVKPGGGYSYATASIHLVSMMIRHVTGMELRDYIGRKISRPLGWGRWGYGYQRAEIRHTPGGGGIALRATDMLRFTYLLLRQGHWRNEQVVPAAYVRRCGRKSPYNPHYPYSLQFNVNADRTVPGAPPDAYWKMGSGGHCIYIVPSLDLVIYKLGGRDGQYDFAQLDVPPPPEPLPGPDESRPGWKAEVDAAEAAHRTLEMVVAAVVGPPAE